MKSTLFFLSTAVLIFFWSCNKKPGQKPVQPVSKPQSPSVQVIVASQSSLENKINSTGTVYANEEVEIRTETQGRIASINFKEGERVQKGKIVIKIDDSELQAELKQAELSVQLASDDEQRKKKLLEVNGISREEYDNALNNLLQLQAQKQLIDTRIAKTIITAPFNGIIGLRYVSEGGYVSSANLITTLQQTDPVKVEFSIPEKYAPVVQNGTQINFTVEGNIRTYFAKVYAKEPKIDPATRTVKIRASCPNGDNSLIPGAFAKVNLNLGTTNNALVVPSQAIIPGITGQSLMLVKMGRVKVTPVKIGIRTETAVEIAEGLNAGDTVIVSGLLTVREGMQVNSVLSKEQNTQNTNRK